MVDLFDAIENSDVDLARDLLARGDSPHPNLEGHSPLVNALMSGSLEMVRLLLEAGADPNAQPSGNLSPLAAAATPELVSLLVAAGARIPLEDGFVGGFRGTSLHYAAGKDAYECLRILLEEAGGDEVLEAYDDMGWTAVGVAAADGHINALEVLLSRGARPNGCDPERRAYTPLHCAASDGHVESVRLLLAYGADPDLCWGHGSSGREAILSSGNPTMIQLLEQADHSPRQLGLRGS